MASRDLTNIISLTNFSNRYDLRLNSCLMSLWNTLESMGEEVIPFRLISGFLPSMLWTVIVFSRWITGMTVPFTAGVPSMLRGRSAAPLNQSQILSFGFCFSDRPFQLSSVAKKKIQFPIAPPVCHRLLVNYCCSWPRPYSGKALTQRLVSGTDSCLACRCKGEEWPSSCWRKHQNISVVLFLPTGTNVGTKTDRRTAVLFFKNCDCWNLQVDSQNCSISPPQWTVWC